MTVEDDNSGDYFNALGKEQGTQTRYGILGDGCEASSYDGDRNEYYYQGQIGWTGLWEYEMDADDIKEIYDRTKKLYQARTMRPTRVLCACVG